MFKGRNQTCKSSGVLGWDGVVWLVVCPVFGGRGEAANAAVAQPTTTQTASLDVVATAAFGVSLGVCGTPLINKEPTADCPFPHGEVDMASRCGKGADSASKPTNTIANQRPANHHRTQIQQLVPTLGNQLRWPA